MGKEGIDKSLPLLIDLLKYGRAHSEITILEGILDSAEYSLLFETSIEEFGSDIFAYYYDLPFEETLFRYSTKPNRFDFGEKDMRKWWREKDYLTVISETILKKDLSLEDAVEKIYRRVMSDHSNETT